MTTFTLFEYGTVTPSGEPVQPPTITTPAIAVDTPTRLAAGTIYAAVTPSADMYIAIGGSGVTAGAGSMKILAGETRGFPVSINSRPYVVGN